MLQYSSLENKRDADGKLVLSNGMGEEFDLCIAAGTHPVPVGATGYMSAQLWDEVRANFHTHFPDADENFRRNFHHLGDSSKAPSELIYIVLRLIEQLQKT